MRGERKRESAAVLFSIHSSIFKRGFWFAQKNTLGWEKEKERERERHARSRVRERGSTRITHLLLPIPGWIWKTNNFKSFEMKKHGGVGHTPSKFGPNKDGEWTRCRLVASRCWVKLRFVNRIEPVSNVLFRFRDKDFWIEALLVKTN